MIADVQPADRVATARCVRFGPRGWRVPQQPFRRFEAGVWPTARGSGSMAPRRFFRVSTSIVPPRQSMSIRRRSATSPGRSPKVDRNWTVAWSRCLHGVGVSNDPSTCWTCCSVSERGSQAAREHPSGGELRRRPHSGASTIPHLSHSGSRPPIGSSTSWKPSDYAEYRSMQSPAFTRAAGRTPHSPELRIAPIGLNRFAVDGGSPRRH